MNNLQRQIENTTTKLTPELTASLIGSAFDVTTGFGTRLKHCSMEAKGNFIYGSIGDIDVIAMQAETPIVITKYSREIKMFSYQDWGRYVDFPIDYSVLEGFFKELNL